MKTFDLNLSIMGGQKMEDKVNYLFKIMIFAKLQINYTEAELAYTPGENIILCQLASHLGIILLVRKGIEAMNPMINLNVNKGSSVAMPL